MTYGTPGTPAECVDSGAALLDDKRPGWAGEISLLRLSMISVRRCVLGQLYGDFGDGLRALDIYSGAPYGFIPSGPDSWRVNAYARLKREWKRAIRQRRRTR